MQIFSKIKESSRQKKIREEFREEDFIEQVKPLVNVTYGWKELADVPDINKVETIYFEQLKEKELFASPLKKDKIDLWKLYIVGNKDIQRVYLEKRMLSPKSKK